MNKFLRRLFLGKRSAWPESEAGVGALIFQCDMIKDDREFHIRMYERLGGYKVIYNEGKVGRAYRIGENRNFYYIIPATSFYNGLLVDRLRKGYQHIARLKSTALPDDKPLVDILKPMGRRKIIVEE